jgi:hypothetical protein
MGRDTTYRFSKLQVKGKKGEIVVLCVFGAWYRHLNK